MPLESDIARTIESLERKTETHPKIAVFWSQYIARKVAMLKKSLDDCEQVLQSLGEEQADVSPEALAAAYLFAVTLRGTGPSTEL